MNIIGHLYLTLLKSMMECVYFLRQLTTCLIPSSLVNQSKCMRTINHISLEESRKLCIIAIKHTNVDKPNALSIYEIKLYI